MSERLVGLQPPAELLKAREGLEASSEVALRLLRKTGLTGAPFGGGKKGELVEESRPSNMSSRLGCPPGLFI